MTAVTLRALALATLWAVLVVGNPPVASATPVQSCQTAKLRALGKVRSCLRKQRANVVLAKPDESAECHAKFAAALQKADARAADAGTLCRYIDNGDGTVIDLNTGLQWEKKDDLGGIHDVDNQYTWSSTGTDRDGTAFTTFLFGLNGASLPNLSSTSSCFTGHCDWRLPTSTELEGILLQPWSCPTHPCIDGVFGPTIQHFYWTETTNHGDTSRAWIVSFWDGGIQSSPSKTNVFWVRAVRGGL